MLLSAQERDAVSRAISEVEQFTDAELVTVLARQSDDYRYVPWLWAGLLMLGLSPLMLWTISWLQAAELLLLQGTLFVVLLLLFHVPRLKMAMVPAAIKQWHGANMARRQFVENQLHLTQGHTGVLVFVSEAERYVEILADRGIAGSVPDEEWDAIVQQFVQRIRQKQVAEGFVEAVRSCGKHLEQQVPLTTPKNELPDHLVVLGWPPGQGFLR